MPMDQPPRDVSGTVIRLPVRVSSKVRMRRATAAAREAARLMALTLGSILLWLLKRLWQVVRLALCALLVLIEPLLRATLIPIAYLSFIMAMIFGFFLSDPRFPKWGMLAFSIGTLWLYWLFVGLMSLFMRTPRGRDGS